MAVIYCICVTCGFRNCPNRTTSLCSNGHDNWLEYRDIFGDGHKSTVKRALKTFNMTLDELKERFLSGESFEKYII